MDPNKTRPMPEPTPPPAPSAEAATEPRNQVLPLIVGGLVCLAVAIGIIWIVIAMITPPGDSVRFSLSSPGDGCSPSAPVKTVTVGQRFYAVFSLKEKLGPPDEYTLAISKDGKVDHEYVETASHEFRCYAFEDQLTLTIPGTYKFTLTHDGKIEAEGTLTVTQ